MMGKIPEGRNNLRQAQSQRGHQGRTEGIVEEGQKTLTPRFYHNLSPHSICKKSPNLLAAALPLLNAQNNAGSGCGSVLE